MAFSLEKSAISSILHKREIKPFLNGRITEKFFRSKQTKAAYSWIEKYHARFQEVPSVKVFSEQFPNFKVRKVSDTQEYFVHELTNRQSYKILVETMAEAGENLTDPAKAIRILFDGLEECNLNAHRSTDLTLADDVTPMFERYENRQAQGKLSGMPYGIPELDKATDGMQKGQFGILYGLSGIGKTWWGLLFGYSAFRAGYKVLHISKENGATEITNRLHALICRVSPYRLRTGTLTDMERTKLGRNSRITSRLGSRYIVTTEDELAGGTGGTQAVAQKIAEYEPDLVIVDGLYLLQDDTKSAEHTMLRNIAYSLKALALRTKTFILGITQATDDHVGFSRGIEMAADVAFYAYRTEEMVVSNCMGLDLRKQREGKLMKMVNNWDLDVMQFGPIDQETKIEESEVELPG